MQFMEAFDELVKGNKIVRDCWNESNGYLQLLYGMQYPWRVIIDPTNAGAFSFSKDEILADNWVLFPKPVKEVEAVVDNITL